MRKSAVNVQHEPSPGVPANGHASSRPGVGDGLSLPVGLLIASFAPLRFVAGQVWTGLAPLVSLLGLDEIGRTDAASGEQTRRDAS